MKNRSLLTTIFMVLTACGSGGETTVTVVIAPSEPSAIEISGTPAPTVTENVAYSFTPSIVTGANGTAEFAIENQPTWASFNSTNGALTGTPINSDLGTTSNISITATDTAGSSSIGPFSITVNAVGNAAPVLNDQTVSGLAYSSNVAFTVTASDADSATSTYVYSVISAPTHGSVVITGHATSAFEYQPSNVSGISGDSFTLQLSDGQDTSATATITLGFTDASAPSLTLSPGDGASNVAANTTYSITSDDPLNTSTITYNGSDGACTGTLQISKDSFTNCIGITSAVASNLNRTFAITGAADIDTATEYKMKVTTGVANLLAVNLASDVTNTFNTAGNGLLITEVSESGKAHDMRWFELYNATSSAIDISTYSFKSKALNLTAFTDGGGGAFSYSYSLSGTHTFSLPSVNIQPGQYLIVRSKHFLDTYTSNERVVYVHDATGLGSFPFWDANGFIDLIESGGTSEDFVTFGTSASPTTASAWSGTFASALPSVSDQYGHSIARNASNSDNNLGSDWSSHDFSTMGGANDVTCSTDADEDGIPDCSEVSGSTFAGLPLYDWGARTGQKDIFIEIDYMVSGGDEAIVPREEALQKVVDAFWAQGVAVHFDVGDLFDGATGIDAADFDLGGGQEVPFEDAMTFSTSPSVYDYKLDYMDYARMQIFHYLIFANTQNGAAGSSGLAELFGNDLIVSLGEWGLNSSNTNNTNTLINYQASTLMHELGHNLGLYHGGDDVSANYEPNYISVMNYLYQLSGLPTIASDEGDRFNYNTPGSSPNLFGNSQNATCYSGLSNAPYTSTFIIGFSHGDAIDLNIASLNETLGLGQSSSDGVDFNCNGNKTETSVSLGSGTWTDHDDWTNMKLDFQHYSSGNYNGFSRTASIIEDNLMPDKVGNDRAPIAEEFEPTADFFARLRAQMRTE